jgi:hypothetical protein
MSFEELSAVSMNLVSLRCDFGLGFDTSIVDLSALIFPELETVEIESEKESDLQFFASVLENSIPQGRGCLKTLQLEYAPLDSPVDEHVDYGLLAASLNKVIEVWISPPKEKGIA